MPSSSDRPSTTSRNPRNKRFGRRESSSRGVRLTEATEGRIFAADHLRDHLRDRPAAAAAVVFSRPAMVAIRGMRLRSQDARMPSFRAPFAKSAPSTEPPLAFPLPPVTSRTRAYGNLDEKPPGDPRWRRNPEERLWKGQDRAELD